MTDHHEEKVLWQQSFHGEIFDFTSKIAFSRFDACTFVECVILIDEATEQLAFTDCVFQDCNISSLTSDDRRALVAKQNVFERPLQERKADFDSRLAAALASKSKLR